MADKLLKVCIVLVSLVILTVVAWNQTKLFLDSYFGRTSRPAPKLVGRPLTRVLQEDNGQLKIRVDREIFHDRLARGYIVSQTPAPGVPVRKDATIFLKISKGSDFREVPDIRGKKLRKARLVLQKARLRIGHLCYVRDKSVERGRILLQYPLPEERLGKRAPVDLLLSDGHREKLVLMPRLLGLSKSRALQVLKQINLSKINIIERPTASDLAGLVIEQRPVGGIQIAHDQNVILTVSAHAEAGENAKTIEISYEIPPGLTEKLLEIAASDDNGRRIIYHKRHMPGETAHVELRGTGSITVQYFLDKVLVDEENY